MRKIGRRGAAGVAAVGIGVEGAEDGGEAMLARGVGIGDCG